jgi:glycosyltransferase involved in cell wall biosynthesis
VKIVLVSDHEIEGGAAQAASRLAEVLACHDDVTRVVLHGQPGAYRWHTVPLIREEPAWRRQLYRLPRRFMPGRYPRPGTRDFAAEQLAQALQRLQPDVINVHNLHAGTAWGWGPHLVELASRFAPVVWTLHDMWSFTGRCAYSYGCERFSAGCGADCPTASEAPSLSADDIAPAWQERRRLFAKHPSLVGVTPSRWLADEARRGLWRDHRLEIIPYGVATSTFTPQPRAHARRALGIADTGPILLISAVDLTERRKGAELLPELWRLLRPRPLTLLTMGRGTLTPPPPHVQVHSLGWVDNDRMRMLAYNAADTLLHPAPVDNFPNVVLEALACGTPTIALPVGGLPELVRPGGSGWLAARPTAEALANAVDRALTDVTDGMNLRASCRWLATSEYAPERQATAYRTLFHDLCAAACT